MSKELFNDLSQKTETSEMLATAKINYYSIDDLNHDNPFLIVFDRPADLGNLGSVIRSANAFDADGIIIAGHGADVYESKVIRASMGSIFWTKIIRLESIESLDDFISVQKKKNNMKIIGSDSSGAVSIKDFKIKRPVMIIAGNEAKGMSVKLKEKCDTIVKIPMGGKINSLNVSCAASILMWEVFKNSGSANL